MRNVNVFCSIHIDNSSKKIVVLVLVHQTEHQTIQRNILLKDLHVANLTRSHCLDMLAPMLCIRNESAQDRVFNPDVNRRNNDAHMKNCDYFYEHCF